MREQYISPKLIVILILKKVILLQKLMARKNKDDVDLRSYLYENKKPGESVTVTVIRDGKTKEVKVKLKQQKEQPKRQSRSERQSPGQSDRDFFQIIYRQKSTLRAYSLHS